MKESKTYILQGRAIPQTHELDGFTEIIFRSRDFEITGTLELLGYPFGKKWTDVIVEIKSISTEG